MLDKVWCACDGGRGMKPMVRHEVDHYLKAECQAPPLPLWKCRAILNSILGDKQHRDGRITITRTLTCPLQVFLEDNFKSTSDIRWHLAAYEGTREHRDASENAPPGWYTEVTFPVEGQPPAMLFGTEIHCTADLVRGDFSAIEEYKKHSESSQRWKDKDRMSGAVDEELAAQMNMQRLLILKTTGKDIKRLLGWHLAQTAANGPPSGISVRLPLMEESEIALIKPFGSRYTVQEHVNFMLKANALLGQGVTKEEAALTFPRVGETMFFSPKKGTCKCDLYCAMQEVCNNVQKLRNAAVAEPSPTA